MKKVLTVIANVILWAVIILAAFFAFFTLATRDPNKVGNFLGYTPMSVQTDSMSPTFDSGDLIIVKAVDPDTLQVGDIVTFHTIIEDNYVLNTHRIIEIEDLDGFKRYVTKGDNNPIADTSTIAGGDIVGKYVCRIPKLGKALDFLQSSFGFFICLLLPMLGFLVYQVYNLIQVSIRYKKAAALEQAEEVARVQAEAMLKAQKAAGIVPQDATEAVNIPAPQGSEAAEQPAAPGAPAGAAPKAEAAPAAEAKEEEKPAAEEAAPVKEAAAAEEKKTEVSAAEAKGEAESAVQESAPVTESEAEKEMPVAPAAAEPEAKAEPSAEVKAAEEAKPASEKAAAEEKAPVEEAVPAAEKTPAADPEDEAARLRAELAEAKKRLAAAMVDNGNKG